MSEIKHIPSHLQEAIVTIKTAVLRGQYEAAKDVNRVQLLLYYGIGKYLSEKTRAGVWGTNALETISAQLRLELPGLRGFSPQNLRSMRQFYETWSAVVTVADEQDETASVMQICSPVASENKQEFFGISFTHHMEIIRQTSTVEERLYYIHQATVNRWSKYELRDHLKWDDFHHHHSQLSNFSLTLSPRQAVKAISTFKDEYLLDFINVEEIDESEQLCVNERLVEQSIVQNIKRFIMTFGRKFCFIGNQYHIKAANHDFYIDLLFFNRELNCLVAIELKAGESKIPYLGELQTYLRLLDEQEKQPNENPSVGLILCKSADRNIVEYVIQDYSKPMGVATYKTGNEMPEKLRNALPDIEELKRIM